MPRLGRAPLTLGRPYRDGDVDDRPVPFLEQLERAQLGTTFSTAEDRLAAALLDVQRPGALQLERRPALKADQGKGGILDVIGLGVPRAPGIGHVRPVAELAISDTVDA